MLAVNTAKGRESAKLAREALGRLQNMAPKFIYFPDYSSSPHDGYVVTGDTIVGIFESKVREAGVSEDKQVIYNGKAYSDYLVTADKLDKGIAHAKAHQVSFYLFVYFQHTDCIAIFTVYDYKTGSIVPFERKITHTQATVNGGNAMRENAFIPMIHAKIIKL